MDFTYSLRRMVQVVDQIGQWEPATIAAFTDAGYMVQFDGWGPEWDLEVSPAEMRLPVKKQSKSLLFHFFGLILLSFQLSASNTKLSAIPFSHISWKCSDRRMACDPTCSLTFDPVLNRLGPLNRVGPYFSVNTLRPEQNDLLFCSVVWERERSFSQRDYTFVIFFVGNEKLTLIFSSFHHMIFILFF